MYFKFLKMLSVLQWKESHGQICLEDRAVKKSLTGFIITGFSQSISLLKDPSPYVFDNRITPSIFSSSQWNNY